MGKNLALREISYLVAHILSKYEISFAPGEDGLRVERDMKDEFTAVPGKLELVLRFVADKLKVKETADKRFIYIFIIF